MSSLIIHGHFYQPPRENPWTGKVEREPGAEPFHDWNERIHAECYEPNAFAKTVAADGSVIVVNNYERISFNFGPTLLSWLEQHHQKTYERILEADQVSAYRRGGHGNAIAQAYGHAILPLANGRDRLTQVVWGIADFRHRFRRAPESLWLPETACNSETLGLLIDFGLRYVILAPEQAESYRAPGEERWSKTSDKPIDTAQPYRFMHPDGSDRSIAVFFYDGATARAIAFERILSSSKNLVEVFRQTAAGRPLVHVATDGETYGHHYKFGDLCLAHTLEVEAPAAGFQITNYGEYLDHHPATSEVRIYEGARGEGSSWSCVHGVDRWIRDCGCRGGGDAGWIQSWRTPLRHALEYLRDEVAIAFETAADDLFRDPWAARNGYIKVLLDHRARSQFLAQHAKGSLSEGEEKRAIALLELQRYSLLMFTSCGWFFSELSGIETLQVLKYAARVNELMAELELPAKELEFLAMLAEARSNLKEKGTGADIYRSYADRETRLITS